MQTVRFGQSKTKGNKDNFISSDEAQSESNTDHEETLEEINSSKADVSRPKSAMNVLRGQICRVEAKLDNVQDIMRQIQRIVISFTNGCPNNSVSENNIPKLPLTTEESMVKFEEDLNDNAFRRSVVSIDNTFRFVRVLSQSRIEFIFFFQIVHLCIINGTNGTKEGGKVIRSVVFATICPTVLEKYTWTGISGLNKSGRKKEFKQFKNIFGVFFDVVHAYNQEYSKSDCEDDIKHRILKHIKKEAEKM